ncbi:NAD-binding protein [Pseudonocardia acidicola]|uniref:TrkA family potassium uptake protein n=1 Tax=Pseudonocardia acidicola TaxID=2724939 RepID=A0ABX1SIV6_9PSEU|nr:TrkA family potassium uptake protein [Pseudonocardia acidicola]
MVAPQEAPAKAATFIICGDSPLALRLAEELVSQTGDHVTVVLPSRERNYGPRIALLPKVRVIEAPELDDAALRAAGVQEAEALALVDQHDVRNIHTALRAQELNPELRLVIRFFNMSLGHRIRTLFPSCVVLSDSATAAPSFVAGALGELAPTYVRLPGRTLFVTHRPDIGASRLVCGLADTSVPGVPHLLPVDDDRADLVLAVAVGERRDPETPSRRSRRRGRAWWSRITAVLDRKLTVAACALFALLLLGTVLFATVGGFSWSDAVYLTVLDAAGAAQPDPGLSTVDKLIQTMVTLVGISMIPVVTAAVIDAVVGARLAHALGRPRTMSDHVVVAGLGNVGSRILLQLHDLGVPVVGVENDEEARGVSLARRAGIPVVIGDASREETLQAAHVGTCRALLPVTNNDVTNLEAALNGRAMREDLRIVLRLFDHDLAERVQRNFGITLSRSVSYLAAPAFVAAMLRQQVLGTIPVGRRVLLIAEVPVRTGSDLVGAGTGSVHQPGRARVIAVHRHATGSLELPPAPDRALTDGDRLIVLATRAGLRRIRDLSAGPPTGSTAVGHDRAPLSSAGG